MPFWRDSFELLVWCFGNEWCLSLSHLVDHFVNFNKVLSSVELAYWLLGCLAGELLGWLLMWALVVFMNLLLRLREWVRDSEDKLPLTECLITWWVVWLFSTLQRVASVTMIATEASSWKLCLIIFLDAVLEGIWLYLLVLWLSNHILVVDQL